VVSQEDKSSDNPRENNISIERIVFAFRNTREGLDDMFEFLKLINDYY